MLGADLLQSVINDAASHGILPHPLGPDFGGDYLVIQYADDTLMVLPVDPVQLASLKGILETFALSIGLKVNFDKSFLVPINVDENRWRELIATLGWVVSQVPCLSHTTLVCLWEPLDYQCRNLCLY